MKKEKIDYTDKNREITLEEWTMLYNLDTKVTNYTESVKYYLSLYMNRLIGLSTRQVAHQFEVEGGKRISHTTIGEGMQKGKELFEDLYPLYELMFQTILRKINNAKTPKEAVKLMPQFLINRVDWITKCEEAQKKQGKNKEKGENGGVKGEKD